MLGVILNTKSLSIQYEHISPAGAEVRAEMSNSWGSVAHCTLTAGRTTKAVAHKTVTEFWHILSGKGEIWRRNGTEELVTPLEQGVTLEISLGTDFQYRSLESADLVFLCMTMPQWPGHDEVRFIEKGAWNPTA
jgi:mannose-6-phosphate isomerase-like protein (cupin superfamily)